MIDQIVHQSGDALRQIREGREFGARADFIDQGGRRFPLADNC